MKAREKKKGNLESEINVCEGINESRRLKQNIVWNIQVEPYFFEHMWQIKNSKEF